MLACVWLRRLESLTSVILLLLRPRLLVDDGFLSIITAAAPLSHSRVQSHLHNNKR